MTDIIDYLQKMNILQQKIVCVTGATGAIGKAIAKNLAMNHSYKIIMAVRDKEKAIQTRMELIDQTGNSNIEYKIVDLSDRQSIYDLAKNWTGSMHALVNNAAITPRMRATTSSGIEMQFATNVLGYFWMSLAFEKYLRQEIHSRIINVASYWAGGLNLDDLEFKLRPYNNDDAYRQSKQANRMLTLAFADKLTPKGISVFSCHPGDVNSNLSNNLGFGGHNTPDEGAETPVWLVTAPLDSLNSGKYYAHRREENCQFSKDIKSIEKLYAVCESYS